MNRISVIVPVYKVEEYLDRCVKSILDQTFRDFELILVDDGSPDRCGKLCDEWAKKDSRIRVIHKENGGLSDARNAGIDWTMGNSDSQWLFFADSDDFIHPRTLELLLSAAEEYGVSISIGGFAETEGQQPQIDPETLTPKLWNVRDYFLQKNNVTAILAWGKLYRKELFAQVRYPVGKLHEDEYTTYKLLFACDKVSVITAPLYGYFVNREGITKSSWSPRRMDALGAFEERIRFFRDREDPELVKQAVRSYAACAARQFPQAQAYPRLQKQLRKKLRGILLRHWSCFSTQEDYWLFNTAFPRLSYRLKWLLMKLSK